MDFSSLTAGVNASVGAEWASLADQIFQRRRPFDILAHLPIISGGLYH